ncbi:monoacylglycerol lipase abhd6-A-like [Ostrea edulis]|uniref:monoacylglycerol lipase abhd6-A-like n=1 Tax=Ostrea edulis TaxID=37623 RepID=UPI002095B815|nr:monoacylglycerol lipase abhd6-A-like [Ostrea edulis]
MIVTVHALFYPLLAFVTSITAASVYIYLLKPNLIVQYYLRMTVLWSGMKIKYTNVNGKKVCYGERGCKQKDRSSILLLHGFSADKSMWAPLVRNLPPNIHVIALDLPGNGESEQPVEDTDLSFKGLVNIVHQIIETLGMSEDPIHVVGLSMGGTIAGLYAAEYPHVVDRVTMMCPAMRTPEQTSVAMEIQNAVNSEDEDQILRDCPLFPQSPDEMQYLLDFAQFHKSNFIPNQILRGAVDMRKQYHGFYLKLLKGLGAEENATLLERTASRITVPSHIVWGQDDQVVHVSGAKVLKDKLPNCQRMDIIPRCGHAINLDRPGSKTKALLSFRGEYSKKNEYS